MMMLRSVVCGWQHCEVLIARASGRRRCSLCDEHGDGYESDDEHDVGRDEGEKNDTDDDDDDGGVQEMMTSML